MATHSNFVAWRIPWTESGGLLSMRSQRVGHDLAVKQFIKGFSSIIHKELSELNCSVSTGKYSIKMFNYMNNLKIKL